jgi:RHS repeat-associated protein
MNQGNPVETMNFKTEPLSTVLNGYPKNVLYCFIYLVVLLLTLPGFSQTPDKSCKQEPPIQTLGVSTNLNKFGIEEFKCPPGNTNSHPPVVALYLTEIISSQSSNSLSILDNSTDGGEASGEAAFMNWNLAWGPGTYSNTLVSTYGATKTIWITNWWTGDRSYYYNGGSLDSNTSANSANGTNQIFNGGSGSWSYRALGPSSGADITQGFLSNNGWALYSSGTSQGTCIYCTGCCPNWTNVGSLDTSYSYWTTSAVVVAEFTSNLVSCSPTQEVYYATYDQPAPGYATTIRTLTDENSNSLLRFHTAQDALPNRSFTDPDLIYGATNRASCQLSLQETNLALTKARYVFNYQTETNAPYLITYYFTVWTNGFPAISTNSTSLTFSNLFIGSGIITNHWETNDISPQFDAANNAIVFFFGTNFLASQSDTTVLVYSNAPITLYARSNLLEVALTKVTIERYGGCKSCGGDNSPGGPGPLLGSAHFSATLGRDANGEAVGEIFLDAPSMDSSLYTHQSLRLLAVPQNITPIYNADGSLRQVGARECLADISALSSGYQIVFYAANALVPGQVTPFSTSGLSAIVTWTVDNPDTGAANRLRFVEARGSLRITNIFTWVSSDGHWELLAGNGLRKETFSRLWSPDSTIRTETRQTLDPSTGGLLAQTVQTYQVFDWGEGLIHQVDGANGVTRTNTYTYYSSLDDASSRGKIHKSVSGDGFTQTFRYGASGSCDQGLPIEIDSSFGHSDTRIVFYHYTNTLPQFLDATNNLLQFVDDTNCFPSQPREIYEWTGGSHSFFVASTNMTIDIRLGKNDGSFLLCTTNRYYPPADPNATKLKSVERPDGTISLYFYSNSNPNSITNVVLTGQPNGDHTDVVNGTRSLTVLGSVGQVLLQQTFDISPAHPSGILTSQDSYTYTDNLNRSYTVTHLDSTTESEQYACCGVSSTTDRDGATTLYYYDPLKRQVASVQTAFNITQSNILDAAGNTLARIRIGGSSRITNWSGAYDALGRIILETNALGGITTSTYGYDEGGYAVKTNSYPDGGTRIETTNPDGTVHQVTGTAVFPVRYLYKMRPYQYSRPDDPGESTEEIKLDSDGTLKESTLTYQNMLGLSAQICSAGGTSESFYNSQGQLWKQTGFESHGVNDGVATLFQYNAKGEQEYSATDINRDDTINFGGAGAFDRITRTITDVTNDNGFNVLRTSTYVWPTFGVDSSVLISVSETTTDGLRSWQVQFRDGLTGITNQTRTVYAGGGYRYVTNTAPDGSFDITTYLYGRLQSVARKDPSRNQLSATTYSYDSHGRQQTVTDARNGATTYAYNNADQVISVATPVPGPGYAAQTTLTYYDSSLRATNLVQPDGTSVTNSYFPTGQLKRTCGSRTYPVDYTYDYAGRLLTMTTWTNFAAAEGGATTMWHYDGALGLLSSKEYPDPNTGQPSGIGPSYWHTPAGLLSERAWFRGIATFYFYDHAGALTNVVYPAYTTPCITNFYDRLGRLSQVQVQGCQSVLFTSDLAGNPLTESWSGGILDGLTITNGYNPLMRRTNLWAQYSGTPMLQQSFTYDPASRISTVSDVSGATAYSATYSYLDNSPLVCQITFKQGANTRMTTTKQYDFLNRLTSISSVPSASSAVSFSYLYNSADQRIQTTLADGSRWVYQYDKLGQVVSGKKYWADWTPVAGQQFEYSFDDIGNRKSTKAGGDDHGANLRSASYSANLLNQYSARDVPGAVDIMGVSIATNIVTVTAPDALNNSTAPYRKGEYFRKEVTLDNTNSGPFWENITVSATGQTSVSGDSFLPQTPEQFTYDGDGNLWSDGRWRYTWDAENRLTNIEPYNGDLVPDNAKLKLVFEYDHLGRRIGKTVYNWVSGEWNPTPLRQTKFVYDGWNLIAELDGMNSSALLRSYLWGLDLSGSLQGAGGVGGLIAVRDQATIGGAPSTHFAAFDGNGNVSALANAADGTLSAQYDYGPFGEPLRATGTMCKAVPMRFSSKYADSETDLLYYGFRYLNPCVGEWLSRDPAGERAGYNLHSFAQNDPLLEIDPFGLQYGPGYPLPPGIELPPSPPINQPSFAVGLLPVFGSLLNAEYNMEQKNYGWAAFYDTMAITDASMLRSMGTLLGRGGWKIGSHTWRATRAWLGRTRSLPPYTEVHHWLLQQNQGLGRWFPEWFKNQPWNLVVIDERVIQGQRYSSKILHMAVHGRSRQLTLEWYERLLLGTPDWAQWAALDFTLHATTVFEEDCELSARFPGQTVVEDAGEEFVLPPAMRIEPRWDLTPIR